jgi:hypothetical protein
MLKCLVVRKSASSVPKRLLILAGSILGTVGAPLGCLDAIANQVEAFNSRSTGLYKETTRHICSFRVRHLENFSITTNPKVD